MAASSKSIFIPGSWTATICRRMTRFRSTPQIRNGQHDSSQSPDAVLCHQCITVEKISGRSRFPAGAPVPADGPCRLYREADRHARTMSALGSDFDGIESPPQQLDDVTTYPLVTRELLKRGYKPSDIAKILGGNFIRVLKANEASIPATASLAPAPPATARRYTQPLRLILKQELTLGQPHKYRRRRAQWSPRSASYR